MKLRPSRLAVIVAGAVWLVGCADNGLERPENQVAPTPRRMVVWLDETGIDRTTSEDLMNVGVDQLVVRRGAILLSGAAPVVRLLPLPPVEGPIAAAYALEVRGQVQKGRNTAADAVWSALEADFGDRLPTELILDLPDLGEGVPEFISMLARRSGLAVVPVLTVDQLQTEDGRAVARSAHGCIVPVFGTQGADLRGLDDVATQPMAVRLAAIADLDVRVRVAAALRPKTDPMVGAWAEDIDPLTDGVTADIKRVSTLDRSFVIKEPLSWGGRSFGVGETIAVAWVDTARLGLFFSESHRMILPEIIGWDLVSLPPQGPNLGLDRAELIRYLGGDGPQPSVEVRVNRNGRSMTVEIANPGVFRSAITGLGNWVQVELASGALVASSRGTFDRVILGSIKSGDWQPNPPGGPDAVRFVETYLAPGEVLTTGTVRVPSSRSRVVVRWQIQLSDGSSVGGVVD
jgi:hypothetical protein